MNYLQLKKRAFMALLANTVKRFIRTVTGTPSVTLTSCVDENSLISLTINGAADGVGDIGKNKFNTEEWYNLLKASETSAASPYNVVRGTDETVGEYLQFAAAGHTAAKLYPKVQTSGVYTFGVVAKFISGSGYAGLRIIYTNGAGTTLQIPVTATDWTTLTVQTVSAYTISHIEVYTYSPASIVQFAQFRLYKGVYTAKTIPEYEKFTVTIPVAVTGSEEKAYTFTRDFQLFENNQLILTGDELKTYEGDTVISVNTEIPPSNITAEYYSTEQEG